RRNPRVAILSMAVAVLLVAAAVGSTLTAVRIDADRERIKTAYNQADDQRRLADARLNHLFVANGVRIMDTGDLLAALPWFARALQQCDGTPAREETHR